MAKKSNIRIPLKTEFTLKQEILPDYPRPGMVRVNWQNLNGIWNYAFTKEQGRPMHFDGDILVPFSPETMLSGVEKQLLPGMYLWYERKCAITSKMRECMEEGGHILLHFGAVDQSCKVYINGSEAGAHRGGYLPFTIDITDYICKFTSEKEEPVGDKDGTAIHEIYGVVNQDFTITLCVEDVTDTSYHSVGKQTLTPGGMYYPGTSGIWQTVWMEEVPKVYLNELIWDSQYDKSSVSLVATLGGKQEQNQYLKVVFLNHEYPDRICSMTEKMELSLPDFVSWSPENPYLYQVRLELYQGENDNNCSLMDSVESYFAMRICDIDTDEKGIQRIFLNHRPYMQVGVLDQGYWPESMYTAPTDEAMIYDIETMKNLGFNMLRKHVKVEPERWYYHCDRLGMLVWQDMINGGRKNKGLFVTYLATAFQLLGIKVSDRHPILLSRQDKQGREEYVSELTEMVRQMQSHPSVVCIVPFNEGWGQFDTNKITAIIKEMNSSIIVDQASGWFDMGEGDLKSIHNYFFQLKVKREKYRAVALTEFGGYAQKVEGHSSREKEYGYKLFLSKEDLTKGYEELMRDTVLPAIQEGVSATVYTQLSDVEEEINGILTYDRKIMKMDIEVIKKYNEQCKKIF